MKNKTKYYLLITLLFAHVSQAGLIDAKPTDKFKWVKKKEKLIIMNLTEGRAYGLPLPPPKKLGLFSVTVWPMVSELEKIKEPILDECPGWFTEGRVVSYDGGFFTVYDPDSRKIYGREDGRDEEFVCSGRFMEETGETFPIQLYGYRYSNEIKALLWNGEMTRKTENERAGVSFYISTSTQ